MDTSIIKEQIAQILESIKEQAAVINNKQHKIPQIELDIIKENIRKLYEYYHQLDYLNSYLKPSAKTQAEILSKEEFPNKLKTNQIAEDVFVEPPQDKISIADENNTVEQVKKVKNTEKEIIAEERKFVKQVQKAKTDPDLFSAESPTISEKLKNNKKLIHDQLTSSDDNSIGAKMQKNPIEDLKAAIGINEKFLFINELFNGKLEEYKIAIDQMNNLESFNKAIQQLNQLKEAYQWEEDTEAFLRLYDFVHRRYLNT